MADMETMITIERMLLLFNIGGLGFQTRVERGKGKGGREWENSRAQIRLFVRRTGLWLSSPRLEILYGKMQLQKFGGELESLGKHLMV